MVMAESTEEFQTLTVEIVDELKQQAETIELLKNGMKGDYDLDQRLDWAISKKHMMETIERLNADKNELFLAIKAVEAQTQITLDETKEFPSDECRTVERLENTLRRIQLSLNKLEAGEL